MVGLSSLKTPLRRPSPVYQAGMDEQLVMERTGYRSVEGVRSYKRTSEEQRLALSDIMIKKPRPTATIDVMKSADRSLRAGPSFNSNMSNSQQF